MSDFQRALKPALYTALFTFLGMLGIALLGFLQEVGQWASDRGATPFPDAGVLVYAAIAGVVAAASGLVNFVIRYLQAKDVIGGEAPVYPTVQRGEAGHVTIAVLVLVVLVLLILLL